MKKVFYIIFFILLFLTACNNSQNSNLIQTRKSNQTITINYGGTKYNDYNYYTIDFDKASVSFEELPYTNYLMNIRLFLDAKQTIAYTKENFENGAPIYMSYEYNPDFCYTKELSKLAYYCYVKYNYYKCYGIPICAYYYGNYNGYETFLTTYPLSGYETSSDIFKISKYTFVVSAPCIIGVGNNKGEVYNLSDAYNKKILNDNDIEDIYNLYNICNKNSAYPWWENYLVVGK